jgi:hypothetical protein
VKLDTGVFHGIREALGLATAGGPADLTGDDGPRSQRAFDRCVRAKETLDALPVRFVLVVLTPSQLHAVTFAVNGATQDAEVNADGDRSMGQHARTLRAALTSLRDAPIIRR